MSLRDEHALRQALDNWLLPSQSERVFNLVATMLAERDQKLAAAEDRGRALQQQIDDVRERIDSVAQCWKSESLQAGFHPPSGTMHAFLNELRAALRPLAPPEGDRT